MSCRRRLPQLGGTPCLTEGGMETTLIFHRGLDLPLFTSFDLLRDENGVEELRSYFEPYRVTNPGAWGRALPCSTT